MIGRLLVRGMLAGLVAGLLMFGFAKLFGEPEVDRAIAFEAAQTRTDVAASDGTKTRNPMAMAMSGMASGTATDEPGTELVSRDVQSGLGLFTGVVVYGAAFGGLFALAFAFALGRGPDALGPRALSLLLALAGFVAVYLVPNLKYPANPPSAGEPDTIGVRTALFFIMIAVSLAAFMGAAALRNAIIPRLGTWDGTLAAVGAYLAVMLVAGLLLPGVDEVPQAFPAALLWKFRIASFGMQAVLWATLGLAFGVLAERLVAGQSDPRSSHRTGVAPIS